MNFIILSKLYTKIW